MKSNDGQNDFAWQLTVVVGSALIAAYWFGTKQILNAPPESSLLHAVVAVQALLAIIAGILVLIPRFLEFATESRATSLSVACFMIGATSGLSLIHDELPATLQRLQPWIETGSQALIVFGLSRFAFQELQPNTRRESLQPYLLGLVIAVVGTWQAATSNWRIDDTSAAIVALTRELLVSLIVPLHLLQLTHARDKQRSIRGLVKSALLRISIERASPLGPSVLWLPTSGIATLMLWSIFTFNGLGEPSSAILGKLQLSWVAAIFYIATQFATYEKFKSEEHLAYKMTSEAARRIMRRLDPHRERWAESVGLKTCHYIIDHDPDGSLDRELPASLSRIRTDEILRCVHDISANRALHHHIIGGRIYSATDPENSIRPCVDALVLFACLYLDTAPQIERRLNQLASILPVIDPKLAAEFGNSIQHHLVSRKPWLFFLDYGWLDQNVTLSPAQNRYIVHQDLVSLQAQQILYQHMQGSREMGGVLWLTPAARERLGWEAPLLLKITEPYPIVTKETSTEHLFFLVKFENLIPRLQRYFELEERRQAVAPFEPSKEANRLLNYIEIGIGQADDAHDLLAIVNTVLAFPWQGFREKDGALNLLVAAHARLAEMGGGTFTHSSDIVRELAEKIAESIEAIGYPGQALHAAIVRKQSLRRIDSLLEAANEPTDRKFAEAWVLLASIDFRRFAETDLEKTATFLEKTCRRQSPMAQARVIQSRTLDAVGNLAPLLQRERAIELASNCIRSIGTNLIGSKLDVELWCFLLDARNRLEADLGARLPFQAETDSTLERALAQKETYRELTPIRTRWKRLIEADGANAKSA